MKIIFLAFLALSVAGSVRYVTIAEFGSIFGCGQIWRCFIALTGSTDNQISVAQATLLVSNANTAGCSLWLNQTTGTDFVATYDTDQNGYITLSDFGTSMLFCNVSAMRIQTTNLCLCMNGSK